MNPAKHSCYMVSMHFVSFYGLSCLPVVLSVIYSFPASPYCLHGSVCSFNPVAHNPYLSLYTPIPIYVVNIILMLMAHAEVEEAA